MVSFASQMFQTPALGTETTRKGFKLVLIGRHWHHLCILQAIKNWTTIRPGNKAMMKAGYKCELSESSSMFGHTYFKFFQMSLFLYTAPLGY